MLNEEPIIPDGSFIPLNLDPPGGEVSTYLFLSLFFSITPSRCVVASGTISRFCLLEIANAQAVRGRHRRALLVVAIIRHCAVERSIFLLTMSVAASQDTATAPSRARIWLPLLLLPHRSQPRRGLVHTITEQLGTGGLTTPFPSSSLALDINSSGVRRLIQAFLRTCVPFPTLDAECT
jgi:hypothetical protein